MATIVPAQPRHSTQHPTRHPIQHSTQTRVRTRPGRARSEAGAASAEYAVVTAAGVGIGGILIKLLTSEWGQKLLEKLLEFFLAMVGVR